MGKIKSLWNIWEFIKSVFESPPLFFAIFGSSGVVVIMFGIIYTWVKNLETIQIILFGIGAFCFLLVIVRWLIDRWQKHNIESIPDLIEQLDVLTSNYVDDFVFQLNEDEWTNLYQDYGKLLGINIDNLIVEFKKGDKSKIESEFNRLNEAYIKKLNPEMKTQESLSYLGDMSSILDTYNSGIGRLKETNQYKKLDKKIKTLQRKSPSALISVRVNDYYTVSERLYMMVLGVKPIYEYPIIKDNLPSKVKAKKSQIRPIVEGQVSNLIAGVRESIIKYKERNIDTSYTEQNNEKQEPLNRNQRRHKK